MQNLQNALERLFRMIFEGNIVVKIRVEKKIGDSVLAFETGQLAKQATACVSIWRYGCPKCGLYWTIKAWHRLLSINLRLSRTVRGSG